MKQFLTTLCSAAVMLTCSPCNVNIQANGDCGTKTDEQHQKEGAAHLEGLISKIKDIVNSSSPKYKKTKQLIKFFTDTLDMQRIPILVARIKQSAFTAEQLREYIDLFPQTVVRDYLPFLINNPIDTFKVKTPLTITKRSSGPMISGTVSVKFTSGDFREITIKFSECGQGYKIQDALFDGAGLVFQAREKLRKIIKPNSAEGTEEEKNRIKIQRLLENLRDSKKTYDESDQKDREVSSLSGDSKKVVS